MKLCIPVTEDHGPKSPVSGHFGSAPLFLLADTEAHTYQALPNLNLSHSHGMCQPLMSLEGQGVEAVAVGGIGRGALLKLTQGGVRVFVSQAATAEETVALFNLGGLPEATLAEACGGHTHGGGCGHH